MNNFDVGKISKLETFSNEFLCFVKLTTTSGNVGWGQTSTYNADITAQIFHRQIAPWAIGMKLENLEESYLQVPFISKSEFAKNGSLVKELNNKIGDHKELKLVKPWVPHLPKDFRDFFTQKTADLIYDNFTELFLFMDYDKDSWKK